MIATIAVLAAIAIPRFASSIGHYRNDAAAQRIIADLAYAQSAARAASASRTVTFDAVANGYTLPEVEDITTRSTPYVIDLADEPYQADIVSVVCDDPGTVLDAHDEIIFDGYGLPDSGGTIVVQAGGFSTTIVIDPDTGTASIP